MLFDAKWRVGCCQGGTWPRKARTGWLSWNCSLKVAVLKRTCSNAQNNDLACRKQKLNNELDHILFVEVNLLTTFQTDSPYVTGVLRFHGSAVNPVTNTILAKKWYTIPRHKSHGWNQNVTEIIQNVSKYSHFCGLVAGNNIFFSPGGYHVKTGIVNQWAPGALHTNNNFIISKNDKKLTKRASQACILHKSDTCQHWSSSSHCSKCRTY